MFRAPCTHGQCLAPALALVKKLHAGWHPGTLWVHSRRP